MNVPSAVKVTVQSFASSRQVPARSAAVAGFSVGAADEGDGETLFAEVAARYPNFAAYQERATERTLPVMILSLS